MWFWCLSSRKFYRIKTWILAAFLLPLEGGSGFAQGGTWPGWKPPFFCTIWSHLLGTNENFEPNNIWVPLYTIICRNTCFTINICVACMHVYYWQLVAFFFLILWCGWTSKKQGVGTILGGLLFSHEFVVLIYIYIHQRTFIYISLAMIPPNQSGCVLIWSMFPFNNSG